jgi:hypothetical protein
MVGGEQGANDRFNSNLNFDAQKFNATNDLANRQFTADQLNKMPERMKQQYEVDLLKAYDAAKTDEERKPVLERWNMLKGQGQQQSKVKPVYGGQTMTEQGAIRNPDILVDENTGRQIDYGVGQASAPYQDGQELRGKDGKIYIVKNGQPILKA